MKTSNMRDLSVECTTVSESPIRRRAKKESQRELEIDRRGDIAVGHCRDVALRHNRERSFGQKKCQR